MVRLPSALRLLLLTLAIVAPPVMTFFQGSRPSLRFPCAGRSSHTRRRLCMSSTKLQDELAVAIQAARKAGIAAKGLQKTLLEAKGAVIQKSDSSPVTIADYSAQALVVEGLRAAFPADQVVAEETSGMLRQDRATLAAVRGVVCRESGNPALTEEELCGVLDHGTTPRARTWILDPIDGTKGFIRGQHFCVALSLALEGKPVLGVLACPNVPFQRNRANGAAIGDGCVFFAVEGQGAFMLPLQTDSSSLPLADEIAQATPIHVSEVAMGTEAKFFESAEAVHSSHSAAGQVSTALGMKEAPVRLDSQCKYGMLARGEGEVMLRLPKLGYVENIWDHAPAFVVIREAGGKVTDTEGKELDFSAGCRTGDGKMERRVTGIVTTNGRLHVQVLEALSRCWPPVAEDRG